MSNSIDTEILLLIFFWFGVLGVANILIKHLFNFLAINNNDQAKLFIYLVIAFVGLCLINFVIKDDNDHKNKSEDDKSEDQIKNKSEDDKFEDETKSK